MCFCAVAYKKSFLLCKVEKTLTLQGSLSVEVIHTREITNNKPCKTSAATKKQYSPKNN